MDRPREPNESGGNREREAVEAAARKKLEKLRDDFAEVSLDPQANVEGSKANEKMRQLWNSLPQNERPVINHTFTERLTRIEEALQAAYPNARLFRALSPKAAAAICFDATYKASRTTDKESRFVRAATCAREYMQTLFCVTPNERIFASEYCEMASDALVDPLLHKSLLDGLAVGCAAVGKSCRAALEVLNRVPDQKRAQYIAQQLYDEHHETTTFTPAGDPEYLRDHAELLDRLTRLRWQDMEDD